MNLIIFGDEFFCLPALEWTGRLGLNNWTEALIKISILSTAKTQHLLNACAKVHGYLSYLPFFGEFISQPAEFGATHDYFLIWLRTLCNWCQNFSPSSSVSCKSFLLQNNFSSAFSTVFNVGHILVVGEIIFRVHEWGNCLLLSFLLDIEN